MDDEATVEVAWGGDARRFRLGIGELLALEDKRACPAFTVFERLREGRPFVSDIVETIRIGLIGGGMDAKSARDLVDRVIGAGKVFENLMTAQIVLAAALMGLPKDEADDPPGKDETATGQDASPAPSTQPGR